MKNIPLYDVRQINNLKEMLNSSVDLYGSRTAFLVKVKGSESYSPITYSQFKSDVDAMGTALINLGLKGKRIAIIGENRYEWAVAYLAVINGTGTVVPLDKELPPNEIKNLVKRSKANAIFYSDSKNEEITDIQKNLDFVNYIINMDAIEDTDNCLSFARLLEKGGKLIEEGGRSFIDAEIDAEAPNVLLFTSGTTDLAKAAVLCQRNIASNLKAMCSMLYIGENDIFLSVLPMHHTYECTCGFLCPLYRGAAVAFCEGLRHIPKNLQQSGATVMLGVPLIFETMYKHIWEQAAKKPGTVRKLNIAIKISNFLRIFGADLTKKLFAPVHESLGGKIRLFISGAAGIDPSASKGFRELGIKLVQGYGLTECSPIVALNRDVDFKDGAAGIPLPNLQVKIDNPGSDGIGEIIVKGPSVMLGYYENTEATAKVLKDGWFHTGDLGLIDKDNFITITGREKNVIVTKNGKNIYPEEIETMLNRSPLIKESYVYSKTNEGEDDICVAAIIVPNSERIREIFFDKQLSGDDIRNLINDEVKRVNKSLVIYKYIRDFSLQEEEFAKTSSRKIKRYLVKK